MSGLLQPGLSVSGIALAVSRREVPLTGTTLRNGSPLPATPVGLHHCGHERTTAVGSAQASTLSWSISVRSLHHRSRTDNQPLNSSNRAMRW